MGYQHRLNAGIRVNNYAIALAAAEDRGGIVLGWKRLVSPLLTRGTLAVLGEHALEAPNRFHLVTQPEQQLSPVALRLRNWLLAKL